MYYFFGISFSIFQFKVFCFFISSLRYFNNVYSTAYYNCIYIILYLEKNVKIFSEIYMKDLKDK